VGWKGDEYDHSTALIRWHLLTSTPPPLASDPLVLEHSKHGRAPDFRSLVQRLRYQALFFVVSTGDQRLFSTVYRVISLKRAPLCLREAQTSVDSLKNSLFWHWL
jgi:hypothetical protein